jgi:hypothetical protein
MTKQEFKQLLKKHLMTKKEFGAKYDIPYDSVRGFSRKTQVCALKLQGGKK